MFTECFDIKRICGTDFKDKASHLFGKFICLKDLLAILPTGYGKSFHYQILSSRSKKRSIVVGINCNLYPLHSIIRDQLDKCRKRGVKAAFLGVKKTQDENGNVSFRPLWQESRSEIVTGKYEIQYNTMLY